MPKLVWFGQQYFEPLSRLSFRRPRPSLRCRQVSSWDVRGVFVDNALQNSKKERKTQIATRHCSLLLFFESLDIQSGKSYFWIAVMKSYDYWILVRLSISKLCWLQWKSSYGTWRLQQPFSLIDAKEEAIDRKRTILDAGWRGFQRRLKTYSLYLEPVTPVLKEH